LKYIKLFEEQAIDLLMAELEDLERLREIGLVDDPDYAEQKSLIELKLRKHAKDELTTNSQHTIYSKEWFEDLRKKSEFRWLIKVVDSPEYAALVAKDVFLSSSVTQLLNHTLVFSKRVNRNVKTDFAIGFFANVNVVKRIFPKTGYRDMNLQMKRFDASLSEIDFFKQAMAWVSETLDFSERWFPAKRTVALAKTTSDDQTRLMDLITKLVQEDMSKISASESQKTIRSLYHTMGGQFEAAVRKNAIKNLINYFENGSCTIVFNSNQTYTHDMITVLSKSGISISHDGAGQYQFEGQITNLDNFNFLPVKDPKARSISILQNPNQSREICFESLEVVLAKLASVGIKSTGYISIYGGSLFSADENERVKRISNRHGIDYLYADTRFSWRD
jgi:hypothetical protein